MLLLLLKISKKVVEPSGNHCDKLVQGLHDLFHKSKLNLGLFVLRLFVLGLFVLRLFVLGLLLRLFFGLLLRLFFGLLFGNVIRILFAATCALTFSEVVAESLDLLKSGLVITSGARLTCRNACFGTSGKGLGMCKHIVTESCYKLCATCCTGLCCGTGCLCACGMTESFNLNLFGKGSLVTGTYVVSIVTCSCTGSILSLYKLNTLVESDLDRVEVVVATYRSNGKNHIGKCNVGVIFALDSLAIVKLVGGVSGIAVDNNLRACLKNKLEGAVLNLRIIATVVADLNAGEVNDRILVVTLRTEGNGGISGDGSVYALLKNDACKVGVGCTLVTGRDNYLSFLGNVEKIVRI